MGGCIPDGPSVKANTSRTSHNPIQQIINEYSLQKLRTKWNAKQLQTISCKIKAFENNTFTEQQFCQLFPKLKNFQASTKHRIYQLFAYQGKKSHLSKKELINALTLIRKVQSKKDFAPLLYYIYTKDPTHQKMTLQEFRFFQQENISYVSQIEELQLLLSQLEQADSAEKIDEKQGQYQEMSSPDGHKKIKTEESNKSPYKKIVQTPKKESPTEKSNGMHVKRRPTIEKVGKGEINVIDLKLFTDILEKYNLQAYQMLFSWDQEEEEKELVQKIAESGIVRKRGETVFIIQYHWWLAWKTYVQIKYQKVIKVDEENHNYASSRVHAKRNSSARMIETIKYNQKEKPQRPGEIKNHCLLKRSKTRGIELAQNLVEYDNYICIPEDLWSKLVAIYLGGPPIERIYPQIYYNLVLKVEINAQGRFLHKALKKFTNKDKKTVMEYAVGNEIYCIPYYKYPGRTNWLKYQGASSQEQPFNCPRTYLVFVPVKLQKQFLSIYNIQETKEDKYLKERLLNYGSQINFSVDGVLTKAEVIQILSKDDIRVSYNDDYAVSKSISVRIDESLRILNPNNLDKESLLNEFSGLANIGNTCYMNAVLQCLIRTPSFGSYLQQQNFKQKKKDEEILLQEMLKIYIDSKMNSQEVINTRNFKRAFDRYCPFFEGNLQHDAQEFLICLLERLSEQIKCKKQEYGTAEMVKDKTHPMQKSVNKKVVQFFSGKTQAITECLRCKNKNKRTQPFFTYSLSLPQLQQAQFFYYFVQDLAKVKSTVPVRYGITLNRKVTIEDFLINIAKVHKKDIDNIALFTVFNNQILNKLQPKSWQNEIAHHLNFDVKLVCYEFKHAATPTYNHYKERRLQNKSVKIELRQRFYSQKANEYKVTYLPMFLEVTAEMKWDDLIKNLNQIIAKLYPNQPTPQPTTTSGIRIAEADIQLSLQASSSGIKGTKKSNSDLKKTSSAVYPPSNAKYKIRVIKTDHYYEHCCMFCKQEFVLSRRSRGTRTCNGKCSYNTDVALFDDSNFRNHNELIIFTVDWQQFPEFPMFHNHPSYQQALNRSQNRKNFLQDLLIKNFQNKEQLQLKCEKKQCGYDYVQRIERIEVPPNILLLHLKRFNYQDNRLIKLTNHVIYPSKFTLPGTSEQYQLYGVVVHIGSGVGGHYISFVQVKGRWYKCDDSKVTLAGANMHIDPNAYLLFYKKVDFQPSLICLSI